MLKFFVCFICALISEEEGGILATLLLTLKTLTSLNKEVRPFLLGDNSIWSFPSGSSLSDYSIWRA